MLLLANMPAYEAGGGENGGGSDGRYQKIERQTSIMKRDKIVNAKFMFLGGGALIFTRFLLTFHRMEK